MNYQLVIHKMFRDDEGDLQILELGAYDCGPSAPWIPPMGSFFRFMDSYPPGKPYDHKEVAGWIHDVTTVFFGKETRIEICIVPRTDLTMTMKAAFEALGLGEPATEQPGEPGLDCFAAGPPPPEHDRVLARMENNGEPTFTVLERIPGGRWIVTGMSGKPSTQEWTRWQRYDFTCGQSEMEESERAFSYVPLPPQSAFSCPNCGCERGLEGWECEPDCPCRQQLNPWPASRNTPCATGLGEPG